MFRDREKALEHLQKQLLEEEDEEESISAEETQDEEDDLPQEVYADHTADLNMYNSDTTDTDLDDYSQKIYDEPQRKLGCALWFILLTAAVLLALSYFLAKQGGLI